MDTLSPTIRDFAETIRGAGGRALLVGGFVRDRLLGRESKDYDFEVYGLEMDELERVLSRFGEVITVGRAFGVLRVKGFDIDFSVPRKDNKIGKLHTDFRCEFDPHMSFDEAARRRDLTINSIGWNPLTGEYLDPYRGREDLAHGRLRATDRATFEEDPLRAVRVAQFRARFELEPDPELVALCREADLDDLSGERLWDEFKKLLLKSRRPSLGFEFLREAELLRFFPELEALDGCEQDAIWHPEGDVWVHTLMVLDEAAALRIGDEEEDLVLMFGALCHDFGKPATTFVDDDGRVRSPNHEAVGEAPTREFMARMRAPHRLTDRVVALVVYHLAPAMLPRQGATPRAYRRLARKLGEADVSIELLARVARADHFGRHTPDALARENPSGEAFLERARELAVEAKPDPDVVLGRHLIERGLKPGRHFRPILDRCREIQDETGLREVEAILELYAREFGPLSQPPT